MSTENSETSTECVRKAQTTPQEAKQTSQDWRSFKMPTIPVPDDSQLEAQLNQRYDLTSLYQQMRSST